jgi:hypothetical protein
MSGCYRPLERVLKNFVPARSRVIFGDSALATDH